MQVGELIYVRIKQIIHIILPVAVSGDVDTLILKSKLAVPPYNVKVIIMTSDDSVPLYVT